MGQKVDQAVHRVVVSRFGKLRRAAYLMCGDWELAEDRVQLALAKLVLDERHNGAEDLDARAWRAVMRPFTKGRRRPLRRRQRIFVAPSEPLAAPRDLIRKISVLATLSELPPRRRAVLVLRHWVRLGPRETADVLGISTATVERHDADGLPSLLAAVGDRGLRPTVRSTP